MNKRKFKKPYRTEREFEIAIIEYERGMISAWEHVMTLCRACIRSHKEQLKDKHVKQVIKFNKDKFVGKG